MPPRPERRNAATAKGQRRQHKKSPGPVDGRAPARPPHVTHPRFRGDPGSPARRAVAGSTCRDSPVENPTGARTGHTVLSCGTPAKTDDSGPSGSCNTLRAIQQESARLSPCGHASPHPRSDITAERLKPDLIPRHPRWLGALPASKRTNLIKILQRTIDFLSVVSLVSCLRQGRNPGAMRWKPIRNAAPNCFRACGVTRFGRPITPHDTLQLRKDSIL